MPGLRNSSDLLVLRRRPRITGWQGLGWRFAAMVGLLGLLILIHWLERDGLKDAYDGQVDFIDVVYFTMISATTTGYGDIVPVTDRTRMFDAIVVTPIRILFILILAGSAYTFVARRSWERFIMKRIQRRLTDHIIVTGFGTKNSRAVQELIDLGADPENIVVIDPDEHRLTVAKELGCTVLNADSTRDETLTAVNVGRAQLMIISAGRDDTSILIVLTVRHLAPEVPISVVVRAEDNELLARQAGANNVINPVRFTGLLLAGSAKGAHIADYLADLASVSGRVQLVERAVTGEEVGRPLSQLDSGGIGLRIYRAGEALGFWEADKTTLEPGDVVVEIIATNGSNSS